MNGSPLKTTYTGITMGVALAFLTHLFAVFLVISPASSAGSDMSLAQSLIPPVMATVLLLSKFYKVATGFLAFFVARDALLLVSTLMFRHYSARIF